MGFFKQKVINNKKLLIVSGKEERAQRIKELLSLKGVSEFAFVNKPVLALSANDISGEFWAVVLDGENDIKASEFLTLINKLFAKDIACVVLGESDSLALQREFLKSGISYLNYGSQINESYEALIKFDPQKQPNSAIKISILGCKGGVGASWVAYHIAKLVSQRFNVPTLFVQSSSSSFNIDILSGINFDKEHMDLKGLSLYKQNSEDGFDFENHKFKSFNFIVYDFSVGALEKEMCEHILNHSDTAIVLSDASIASLRKAKEVLKINRFLKSVNKGAAQVMFCLNTPYKSSPSLEKHQIEQITEVKPDLILPNTSSPEINSKLSSKTLGMFEQILNSITGGAPTKTSRFFSFKVR